MSAANVDPRELERRAMHEFNALPHAAQCETIRALARDGRSIAFISQATRWAPEAVLAVLAEAPTA